MSENPKRDWSGISHFIVMGLGLIILAWSMIDFKSLDAVVTSPTLGMLAPYLVAGALFLIIGITIAPMVGRIMEENKNVKLRARLLETGVRTTATVTKIENMNLDVNQSPLLRITFETKDHSFTGSFKSFALKMQYDTKVGDKITIAYNPMNPKEVIPAKRIE